MQVPAADDAEEAHLPTFVFRPHLLEHGHRSIETETMLGKVRQV
jgi:hypothetical protein